MKIHELLTLKLFQTHKTFIRLQNRNNTTTSFKGQEGSKNVVKIVHVTSVVQP